MAAATAIAGLPAGSALAADTTCQRDRPACAAGAAVTAKASAGARTAGSGPTVTSDTALAAGPAATGGSRGRRAAGTAGPALTGRRSGLAGRPGVSAATRPAVSTDARDAGGCRAAAPAGPAVATCCSENR